MRFFSILLAVGGCFLLDFLVTTFVQEFYVRLVILAGLYVTLAVSLNLINGITGQFSIGHAAFYMVGAYSGGLISNLYFANSPFAASSWILISLVAGGIFAALAGLVVGLPSLRLKGDYLAIVTLGFGEILRIIVFNQEPLGRSYGMEVVPGHRALWLVWLLAITCIAVCRNLLKSAHGLGFLAVREDEIAAQAMGVSLTKQKVIAFVVGAAFAGAAGALLAHTEGFVTPDQFKMEMSFLILTMVVLGGSGSITGSALAGATLFIIPELPRIIKFEISLALLVAILAGIGTLVWMNRRFMAKFHDPNRVRRTLLVAAANLGLFATFIIVGKLVERYTILGDKVYEASNIRYMILAVVLLVVMLLRPAGLLAEHEFSWDWVKSLFRRREPAAEVTS